MVRRAAIRGVSGPNCISHNNIVSSEYRIPIEVTNVYFYNLDLVSMFRYPGEKYWNGTTLPGRKKSCHHGT